MGHFVCDIHISHCGGLKTSSVILTVDTPSPPSQDNCKLKCLFLVSGLLIGIPPPKYGPKTLTVLPWTLHPTSTCSPAHWIAHFHLVRINCLQYWLRTFGFCCGDKATDNVSRLCPLQELWEIKAVNVSQLPMLQVSASNMVLNKFNVQLHKAVVPASFANEWMNTRVTRIVSGGSAQTAI